ncbi:MAG: hypothetical protein Q4F85_02205 [Prevotella sp.]|nr:hypothetical protein [Prevotella sp.]
MRNYRFRGAPMAPKVIISMTSIPYHSHIRTPDRNTPHSTLHTNI